MDGYGRCQVTNSPLDISGGTTRGAWFSSYPLHPMMDRVNKHWDRSPEPAAPGAIVLYGTSHSGISNNGLAEPKFPPQYLDIPDIVQTCRDDYYSAYNGGGAVGLAQQQQQLPPVSMTYDRRHQQQLQNHLQQQTNVMASFYSRQNGSGGSLVTCNRFTGDVINDCLSPCPPHPHLAAAARFHALSRLPTVDDNLLQTMKETKATEVRRSRAARRKKRDPNEPQKPVSAYAMFFRDTQAAIKGQNPVATFGDISKIVAAMWDNLDDKTKAFYKKRTDVAKKDYLKRLAAYRASQVSQEMMESSPDATAASGGLSTSPGASSFASSSSPVNGCSLPPTDASQQGTYRSPVASQYDHVATSSTGSHGGQGRSDVMTAEVTRQSPLCNSMVQQPVDGQQHHHSISPPQNHPHQLMGGGQRMDQHSGVNVNHPLSPQMYNGQQDARLRHPPAFLPPHPQSQPLHPSYTPRVQQQSSISMAQF